MKPQPRTRADHPAVASAKRAIRRTLDKLTPAQLFQLAANAETAAYGRDRGSWTASYQHAIQEQYQWKCDHPSITKKGGPA